MASPGARGAQAQGKLKANAARSPEERRESARKGLANRDPEAHREAIRKAQAARGPEARKEASRRAAETRRRNREATKGEAPG